MAHPACPRCGYDQSGEIARWSDPAVPPAPRGKCVECGLEFEWIDVLDADRRNLPGFFEHARGFVNFLTSAWRTWSWTVLPWRFWSRVQMHHEVRVKRALMWSLVLWISVLVVVHAAEFTTRFIYQRNAAMSGVTGQSPGEDWNRLPPPTSPLSGNVHPIDLINLGWPLIELNEEPTPRGWGRGFMNWDTWLVYPPILFRLPLGILDAIISSIGFPLMLAVLPHTRARAKVRSAHVLRATGFGFAWLGAGTLLIVADAFDALIAALIDRRPFWPDATLANRFAAEWHWYVLLWIAIWWYFALARGFKIERAWIVWLASTIPVALLVAIVRSYVVVILKVY